MDDATESDQSTDTSAQAASRKFEGPIVVGKSILGVKLGMTSGRVRTLFQQTFQAKPKVERSSTLGLRLGGLEYQYGDTRFSFRKEGKY